MERFHDKATVASTNLVCLKEKGKELDRGERKVPVSSAAKKPSFSYTSCSSYGAGSLESLFLRNQGIENSTLQQHNVRQRYSHVLLNSNRAMGQIDRSTWLARIKSSLLLHQSDYLLGSPFWVVNSRWRPIREARQTFAMVCDSLTALMTSQLQKLLLQHERVTKKRWERFLQMVSYYMLMVTSRVFLHILDHLWDIVYSQVALFWYRIQSLLDS